ncbi:transmembrane domain-containing protein [Halobacillus litoralis]|uniref:EGFR-like transmembrane domain-containing protein n=1 Tax=Halobacillus litoralis TaxID=45668 RepID=UPI001CFD4AF9|nr:transmembrane domain-containing protein [Halobacillus litoralis]WLR48608.1 transmembrane domain-containing protein [Halobacillus litoralis]
MSKFGQVFVVIFMVTILTACVEGDLKLKINKDGSGEHTITAGVEDDTLSRFGNRAENTMNSVSEELESKGYEVESYHKSGFTGFRAKKNFEDVQEMEILPVSSGMTEAGVAPAIGNVPVEMTTEGGIFTTTYKVEAELDLSNSGVIGGMQSLVADQLDLTFTLDLPIKPKSHNADRVDGDVLQWDIRAAGETNMMVEMVVPNVKNIIIAGVAAVVVLGLIFFLIRKRRRN